MDEGLTIMEEHLYIVIWRSKIQECRAWRAESEAVFTERRLAENFIECKLAASNQWEFAIVEGPIVNPDQMAEAEARLGAF